MTTTTVSAPNIVCQGCANAIKKAVGALGGVAEVAVDVAAKKVTVKHDEASAPRQSVTEAMERAGFSAS